MANATQHAGKTSSSVRDPKNSDRPTAQENSAVEAKKRGRKPNPNGPKQQGKDVYPGVANGQKLSAVPTDWNGEVHKRLREENFATAAIFTAWKEANKKERNFHPLLLNAVGEPENKLAEFPADVSIEVGYDYSVGGEKIVALRPRHFSDRRSLAKAIVPVLQREIAKLEKVSTMTDEQIAKLEKREELQKAISRKVNVANGQVVDKEALDSLVSMLPPEMRAKLGYAD